MYIYNITKREGKRGTSWEVQIELGTSNGKKNRITHRVRGTKKSAVE